MALKGQDKTDYQREYMRKRRSNTRLDGHCVDCGFNETPAILMFHHIDGDRSKNSPANKVRLCPNCHAKRHLCNGRISFKDDPVRPALDPDKDRLVKARAVLAGVVKPKTDALQSTRSPLKEESNTVVPLYNPKTSKPGELVRKWIRGRYVGVIVKEVDGEGNEIPEY